MRKSGTPTISTSVPQIFSVCKKGGLIQDRNFLFDGVRSLFHLLFERSSAHVSKRPESRQMISLVPESEPTQDYRRTGRVLLPALGGVAGTPADRSVLGDDMKRNQKPSGAWCITVLFQTDSRLSDRNDQNGYALRTASAD